MPKAVDASFVGIELDGTLTRVKDALDAVPSEVLTLAYWPSESNRTIYRQCANLLKEKEQTFRSLADSASIPEQSGVTAGPVVA